MVVKSERCEEQEVSLSTHPEPGHIHSEIHSYQFRFTSSKVSTSIHSHPGETSFQEIPTALNFEE
jgi:hypothetical protein